MPFVKWIGKIKAPFMEKKGLYKFYEIQNILQPGDVILTTVYGHLSNIFNPSKIKHAIAYYGKDIYEGESVPFIVEAVGAGVFKRPALFCIGEKDEVIVMRPKPEVFTLTNETITKYQKFLDSCVGAKYDYKFNLSEEALADTTQHKFMNFYCSELVYLGMKAAFPGTMFKLRESMGVQTVTPLDFYLATDKFYKIFEMLDKKTKKKLEKLL